MKVTRKIRLVSLIFLIIVFMAFLLFRKGEGFQNPEINKTIWLLWLQGWDKAPWLPRQIKKSWEIKNPGWKVKLITRDNLKHYVTDIDYVYQDSISPQAKSDIIRLSLLKNHGGVWADATLLCMQPLDNWVNDALAPSNFWMYHGTGGGMDIKEGPASWFIVSGKGSVIITKWKAECDEYWKTRSSTDNYFWMDSLFKKLYETDNDFKTQWDAVPYISCEDPGQAHMFAEGAWKENTPEIKSLLDNNPPRVLKLWERRWTDTFPDTNSEECRESNGYYAIQLAISDE
jgi:hypothetical protein